jgi:hypothetical protein
MEVGFQQGLFLQDRRGVGISPGKVLACGGEREMVCDGKASALVLDDSGREFQGAKSTVSSSNGFSSVFSKIPYDSLLIYRGFAC